MELPKEWEAIANEYNGDIAPSQLAKFIVERCYALHTKPPVLLTDAEILREWVNEVPLTVSGLERIRAIEAAAHNKQREPRTVKFRAAQNRVTGKVLMFGAGNDGLGTDWKWLEPEQSFEVTLL